MGHSNNKWPFLALLWPLPMWHLKKITFLKTKNVLKAVFLNLWNELKRKCLLKPNSALWSMNLKLECRILFEWPLIVPLFIWFSYVAFKIFSVAIPLIFLSLGSIASSQEPALNTTRHSKGKYFKEREGAGNIRENTSLWKTWSKKKEAHIWEIIHSIFHNQGLWNKQNLINWPYLSIHT